MPANVYECLFILDSTKVAGNVDAADKQIRAILEKNSAEVLVSRQWGDDRKFTYPIKNHKKGIYYLTYFSSEGKNLATIENDFSLNESILRLMIIKIHPKLVEVMLTLMATLQEQQERLESELRRFARADRRCQALETILGVGPILACHLLAELGEASRF